MTPRANVIYFPPLPRLPNLRMNLEIQPLPGAQQFLKTRLDEMFSNYLSWLLRETDQFRVISRSQSQMLFFVDWQFPGRIYGVMYRGYKKIELHTRTITLIAWITLSLISFDFSGIKWTKCWITTWQVFDKFYKRAGCVCNSLSETKMTNHDQ